jgi:hypothetical protein
MSFTWPEFENEPLDGGRTWAARFDSHDQRRDDPYFLVTLSDGEDVTNQLRSRIAQVAATGKTNTTYRGPVMRL